MKIEKRMWIYSGLGKSNGGALVQRKSLSVNISKKILLIGGKTASLLGPFLARIASGKNCVLRVDATLDENPETWIKSGRLEKNFKEFIPNVVLLALNRRNLMASRMIRSQIIALRSLYYWLPPLEDSCDESAEVIPAAGDDAASFAAWSVRIWNSI